MLDVESSFGGGHDSLVRTGLRMDCQHVRDVT